LLEKEKNYSECLATIDNYEKIEDIKGLTQNDLRLIRERKRRVTRILEPNKKTKNSSFFAEQIETLQTNPNMFHEKKYLTDLSHNCSTCIVTPYRVEIKHLGLAVSYIIEEYDEDKLTKKVNEQFEKWDKEWLRSLNQDLAEAIKAESSV
jgi:hypothetical protein